MDCGENAEPLLKKARLSDEIPKISESVKDDDKLKQSKSTLKSELKNDTEVLPTKNDKSEPKPSTSRLQPFIRNQTQSPKKKLDFKKPPVENKSREIFKYGNYSRYYGYRNFNLQDFQDIRLEIFGEHTELFRNKEILDIGCNSGLITVGIAENNDKFNIKYITGIDIDKSLINRATKFIEKKRRTFKDIVEDRSKFPFNIKFVHGNYVVKDDVLLEIESEQFDIVLCLSVTKWIHLNFGDAGLKRSFRRMFLQLRSGGFLILEAQPWDGYKRRKKITPEIFKNYKAIELHPKEFSNYLLGPEVGFSEMKNLAIPEHHAKGFRRPIQMFYKK